jgi:SAM-dependent methyltransferase
VSKHDPEGAVRACYSTWSDSYYDDYYGARAPYPPVHVDLLKRVLRESGAQTVLDAGCGPASFLREIVGDGYDLYGFDLTPEMVDEARRVFAEHHIPPERIWEGSVTDAQAFRPPVAPEAGYDAAVCVGVLPHVPEDADGTVISNLRDAVREGGLVVAEARNQLFALYTLNRYSFDFFRDVLLRAKDDDRLDPLRARFRMDLPPVRRGHANEPGYDEVLSRTHNPFELRERFDQAGLVDVRTLFYHYHALPPLLEPSIEASLALEDPNDWRGHFMASAFLVVGRRA